MALLAAAVAPAARAEDERLTVPENDGESLFCDVPFKPGRNHRRNDLKVVCPPKILSACGAEQSTQND